MRNNNIKHALIFMLLLSAITVSAQSGKLKKANDAMQDLDFVTAISLYKQILQNDDNPEAKINIAECFRKINDTENAEYWYGQVVRLPNARPVHRLYYGMMLQANSKCDVAKVWLKQYQREVPDDARGQYLAKACDVESELKTKNKGIYILSHMPFNSNADDFSPTIMGDKVIFASDRLSSSITKRTSMWTGNPFAELYTTDFAIGGIHPGDFTFGSTLPFSKDVNTKYHEASVSVAADGKMIYFTRNNYDDGKTGRSDDGLVKLKIYAGYADGKGGWTNIVSLPFNSNEYSIAHPSVSADGNKLYFSSNMPGGYGGMDLYISEMENGRWGPPFNLGPVINTEGNEIFPFIDPNNRLYFASNGHIGMGGLDLYYSMPQGANSWNLPVNLGFPVNSNYDDFGIVFGGDLSWGFFTSDRDGGVGRDDIYGFQKSASPVEIYVYDSQTRQPISGAQIANSKSGITLTTGPDGKIAFDMRFAECADFSAGKKGYEPALKQGCTNEAMPGEITRIDIALQKQANFTIQGIVFDMSDGLPAEGVQVYLTNGCSKNNPEPFTTGADGRYKFKLDKDCCYTVKAVKSGFIAGVETDNCTSKNGSVQHNILKVNLNLQPYRDSEGFIVNNAEGGDNAPSYNGDTGLYENPDGTLATFDIGNGLIVKNGILFDNGTPNKPGKDNWERSTTGFLVNIYYDYDAAAIREESATELEKLFKTLRDNPDLRVEIASHTDARGSDNYNLVLSQRRADAVVNWLIQKGVARERLTAKGYGESQLINNCQNEVPCTENEHQMNRRTEFRILNASTGFSNIKPQGNTVPKVGACAGCPF